MKNRIYYQNIWKKFDANKHLILISGPRQTGKTTLAKLIAENESDHLYFNYDIPGNKAKLVKNPLFFQELDRKGNNLPLIILDEIHKYNDWKNYLKGIYDGFSDYYRFLVTGSGRLDIYQKGGDSLAGRYWQFHLFPFTLGELVSSTAGNSIKTITENIIPDNSTPEIDEIWNTLVRLSGFPEPFLSGEDRIYRLWAENYHRQVIREDVRDEFSVKNIDTMESLYTLLPDLVGSLLSTSNIAQLLKVSHNTIDSWIKVFERFYLIFKIKPYYKKIPRSILKNPKIFLYDYRRIKLMDKRFENMVALELKRAVTIWTDYGLGSFDLWFLRNKEKEEVDFLITKDSQPFLLVETKLNQIDISKTLIKFQDIFNIPAIQLINKKGICRLIKNKKNSVLVISASRWLAILS